MPEALTFRLFDQNIPENALGNYAAYKQLRILYLHVWVGVTQPKGPEKPHYNIFDNCVFKILIHIRANTPAERGVGTCSKL